MSDETREQLAATVVAQAAELELLRAVAEAARQRDYCDERCLVMQPYRGCTCGSDALDAALDALDAAQPPKETP